MFSSFSFWVNVTAAVVWFFNCLIDATYYYITGLNDYLIIACFAAFLIVSHSTVAYLVRKELPNVQEKN